MKPPEDQKNREQGLQERKVPPEIDTNENRGETIGILVVAFFGLVAGTLEWNFRGKLEQTQMYIAAANEVFDGCMGIKKEDPKGDFTKDNDGSLIRIFRSTSQKGVSIGNGSGYTACLCREVPESRYGCDVEKSDGSAVAHQVRYEKIGRRKSIIAFAHITEDNEEKRGHKLSCSGLNQNECRVIERRIWDKFTRVFDE